MERDAMAAEHGYKRVSGEEGASPVQASKDSHWAYGNFSPFMFWAASHGEAPISGCGSHRRPQPTEPLQRGVI